MRSKAMKSIAYGFSHIFLDFLAHSFLSFLPKILGHFLLILPISSTLLTIFISHDSISAEFSLLSKVLGSQFISFQIDWLTVQSPSY